MKIKNNLVGKSVFIAQYKDLPIDCGTFDTYEFIMIADSLEHAKEILKNNGFNNLRVRQLHTVHPNIYR